MAIMFANWIGKRTCSGPAALIARIWRDVLDEATLLADMPFDEAGGDSLKLLRFVFLVEEIGGVALPMEACHTGLRPSDFVQLITSARAKNDAGSTEPTDTLFLIPGLGGETPLEGGFRSACAPGLHVAVVALPDWPAMTAPGFTMDRLIEQSAAEIIARAPSGPIRLAGYSFGGQVAFGIARVLAERGKRIAFLGILDARAAVRSEPAFRKPAFGIDLRRVRWEAHNLLQAAARGEAMDRVGQIFAEFLAFSGGRPWRLRFARWLRRAPLPASFTMFVNIYLRETLQKRLLHAWQTGGAYACQRLDTPVVLFRSDDHTPDEPADLGWGGLCRHLGVVNVTGGHKSMLGVPHRNNTSAQFVAAANRALAVALPDRL